MERKINMPDEAESLPSRERGLKYVVVCLSVWGDGRSPRGSVD